MNIVPRVAGPRVAGKDHADQTFFKRDLGSDFELRFVPAARDRSMWCLLHLSNCGAPIRTRPCAGKEGSVPAARMMLSPPQTADASAPVAVGARPASWDHHRWADAIQGASADSSRRREAKHSAVHQCPAQAVAGPTVPACRTRARELPV